jgi:hypothetical protein
MKQEESKLTDEIKAHTVGVEKFYGLIELVFRDMQLITYYMGFATVLSFWGLFIILNFEAPPTWFVFTIVVYIMGIATVYFSTEWRNMRELSEIIDRNSVIFERAINEKNNK